MITLLLVATVLSATPMDARACEPLRVPLRIRVTVDSPQWDGAEPVIKQVVEDTWLPAGVRIEWASQPRVRADFWIAATSGMKTTIDGGALGMVQFDGDRPAPLARVSIDAARAWARRHRARLLHAPIDAVFGRAEDAQLIRRVMAYAAAHELGHFVLATKSHAPHGVMRASYQDPGSIFDATKWRLDRTNAALLRQRLSACADRP